MATQGHAVARRCRVGTGDLRSVALMSSVGGKQLHCFFGPCRAWGGLCYSLLLRVVVFGVEDTSCRVLWAKLGQSHPYW